MSQRSTPLPIPPFTSHGILPIGIHDCTLSEIEGVFVYNERRRRIWDGFQRYYRRIEPVSELDLLYLDGSFVTDWEQPSDIDVVIEYPDDATFLRLIAAHRFLKDRVFVKSSYRVDMLPCLPVLPPGVNDLREYFQYVKLEDAIRRGLSPSQARKGILRVSIRA